MIDLFKDEATDDLPEFLPITLAQAEENWEEWLVWRNLGKRNMAGAFEPSIDYLSAVMYMPKEKLEVFLAMDSLYGKMERQYIKQTAKKKGMMNG